MGLTESIIEEAASAWLGELGCAVVPCPRIVPGEPKAERADYGQVVREDRPRQAIAWSRILMSGCTRMNDEEEFMERHA
jgi:hypothetical protein